MSYNFSHIDGAIDDTIEWLRKEYTQVSTGRANPVLLDSIMIESYGAKQPVKNVASITVEEARTLRIVPWDKSTVQAIERAIADSGLPLSVSADDNGIRVSIPQLTEESKKSLVKLLKEKHEQARVTLRQEREKSVKEIDALESSDDQKFSDKELVQKKIDEANKQLDVVFAKKETDLMSV